jgi:hypothetical protein
MASSIIDWICGQCTHKNEGSSEPGPCHFCQTPHPKRKAVVVSVPTSASPAKYVCICQPARSSGSAIDLSTPDAAQAVAFESPAKPVCIGQPARYSSSVIDMSDPDAAQAVASTALLAKAVNIRQPAPRYSGSVIDLYAPDAVLVVASALLAKPVFICQPAPCYSGSVIDLWSAPDGALALASTSLAKPVFGLSSGIVIDIAEIDVVKENRILADQNHALAIVVEQMKSREIEATHMCRALEESRDRLSLDFDWLYSDYLSQRDMIDDLQAWLANNNADLISELQESITSLEEAAEEASWTDWRQSEEIRRLEGIIDARIFQEWRSLSIGRDPAIVSFSKRIAVYLVRLVDYNFRSTICGPAIQERKARWNILYQRNQCLVLLVWGRQRGWTTIRPTTVCHFFLVLTTWE